MPALFDRLYRRLATTRSAAPRVGVVLAGFDADHTQASVRGLERWTHDYPGEWQACLVANRPIDVTLPPGWTLVEGSNVAHEFSAYDEGIAHLGGQEKRPEVWVLCNDRLLAYERSYLDLVTPASLGVITRRSLLAGHVDWFDRPVVPGGEPLGFYVRTNLICMGDLLRSRLGLLTRHRTDDRDRLFPTSWPFVPWSWADQELSPEWLDFVAEWLTGRGERLPRHWHRAQDDPAKADALRTKAVAIVNEHLLSRRVKGLGGEAVSLRRAAALAPLTRAPGRLDSRAVSVFLRQTASRRLRSFLGAKARRLGLR